jgi:hypothetical protein
MEKKYIHRLTKYFLLEGGYFFLELESPLPFDIFCIDKTSDSCYTHIGEQNSSHCSNYIQSSLWYSM